MGIVDERITGRDGVVRTAKLRAGNSQLDRALQQLYPLELTCDRAAEKPGKDLNPDASEFTPQRKVRRAASDARNRLAAIAAHEEQYS